ncbi:MAG: hypothetical protein K1X65_17425 [Caldilineales bacterium]|nr:hypothetical protein [Caldilineales bacterium]
MKHRSLRLPALFCALALCLASALLLAACQPPKPVVKTGIDLPAPPPDANTSVVPDSHASGLTWRNQAISPELKAAYNLARGRPATWSGDVADLRNDWFWSQRAYPLDTVPPDANVKAIEHRDQTMEVAAQEGEQTWQSLGPAPIANGIIGLYPCGGGSCDWRSDVSGRTKVIAFHPTNANIVYLATATGGIWKTTDSGNTYTALTDDQPSMAFHSLVIDPSNPNTLYAGTGEISGYYGVGVLKSTDGGENWTRLGANVFGGNIVSSLVIHPTNPTTLWASTTSRTQDSGPNHPRRSVFRSTNGGQTWEDQIGCDECSGFSDLVIEDSNPQVLYAGVYANGIYRTTDGGASWSQLTNGLPDRGFSRVELGIGKGQGAGVIYAGFDARIQQGGNVVPWGLIYRSTDHGQSWQELVNAPNYCGGQCFYDNIITVDPTNANIVYAGGSFANGPDGRWAGVVFRSTNGGQSWDDLTPAQSVNTMVHPDLHAIAVRPSNPNEIWLGNDGGVFVSTNGGATWSERNGNLATLQFVNIGIHPTNPNIAFGGLQDNAKAKYNGTGWEGLDTGDGGYSEIDPFNPSIWYSTRFSQQGNFVSFQRNEKGGTASRADWLFKSDGIDVNDRMLFYVPFAFDRTSQGVLYIGTHRLYRTVNRGDLWQVISPDLTKGADTGGAISTIAVAPTDGNTIFTGASDGFLALTRNGGDNWFRSNAAILPNRSISDFAISPVKSDIAYVVYNGYDSHTPGTPGHIFKTTDGGDNWQNISNNLPDIPLLTVVIDPQNPTHLYVGSDIGVFRSTNDGGSWASYNTGLANVPIYDLELNNTTRQLWAGTHGRGAYRLSLTGSAPTPTPTLGANARKLWLPLSWKVFDKGPAQATPTLPPSGPAPGEWEGEKATFGVTGDQQEAYDVRIRVPVPGCETWVMSPEAVSISSNHFSFTVDLNEDGLWEAEGQFTSRTQAQGTAVFQSVYFGQSCGTYSGDVQWTATWRRSGADPTATPTPTRRPPTATPSGRRGIYGQFRYRGTGIADINLILRRCPNSGACSLQTSKVAETSTDANGYYQFTNIPSLPANNYYFVYFYNHPDGNNPGDDKYLWRWFGKDITSYSAGANVSGGDAEIEDINLTGPTADSTTLPASFTWDARSKPGEYYAWELFDLESGETKCYSNPAQSTSYQLTAATFTGACQGSYGAEYGWFAWVVDGSSWNTNNGFGDSYYYSGITFSGGGPTPTPTRTPTRTPTPTPPAGSGISGKVTASGAGVNGLNIQLLLCEGSDCTIEDNKTTSGGGNYSFTGVSAPGASQAYNVRYLNSASGGNTFNGNYLTYWWSQAIASASATNVNFDIADVKLTAPANNYAGDLPITFTWTGRGIGSDRFLWATTENGEEFCGENAPHASTSFTLTSDAADECVMYYDTPYGWYVYVAKNGDFNAGYGLSAYTRTYTITGAAATGDAETGVETGRPLREGRWPNQALVPDSDRVRRLGPDGLVPRPHP